MRDNSELDIERMIKAKRRELVKGEEDGAGRLKEIDAFTNDVHAELYVMSNRLYNRYIEAVNHEDWVERFYEGPDKERYVSELNDIVQFLKEAYNRLGGLN